MYSKDRMKWLASLKLGNKVITKNNIGVIIQITPKRFFVVKFGDTQIKFNQNGINRSDEWYIIYMQPYSKEEEEKIKKEQKRSQMIGYLNNVMWSNVEYEKLENIIKIVRGA